MCCTGEEAITAERHRVIDEVPDRARLTDIVI